jgi:hypothetical protein
MTGGPGLDFETWVSNGSIIYNSDFSLISR